MQPRQQGFEQSDEDRLASKLQDKNNPNQINNTFFVMPQAKPLLSKNIIDDNKPKVLIKQIQIFTQPAEIIAAGLSRQIFSLDKPHNLKVVPNKDIPLTTIWDKYILSQSYNILYLKYYREDLIQLQKKSFKKFKNQLQKMFRNESYLFSTYLIDLSFLYDSGTHIIRNIKPTNFQELISEPTINNTQFNSRFQCGNLFAVFEKKVISPNISTNQYDLILQSDINSKGFSNWFYFSIRNKKKTTIKLNIVNMQKIYSLFNEGMKVFVFSMRRLQKQNIQWHRDGYGYSYHRNQLRKNNQPQSLSTYSTLTFSYDFKYDDDIVYIAASLPYSYSKMLRYIQSIEKVAKLNSNIYFKKQNLANSITSNSCPIITLTWKRDKRKDVKRKRKKIIGLIARQHPCQAVSSYVIQGFINSLIYLNNQSSVQLLQNYIFKIVPMVNVDGVIYGNSRCDISGNDINRKWTRNPNKFIYPIISGIKSIFYKLVQQEYQIDYFIDFHGHSRKMGAFIYGCKTYDELESRQTAWILSRINSKVLFQQCQFGISQFKRETARGVMCDLVVAKKSMTLQTSFYGYKTISNRFWDIKDLQKIGSSLIQTIYAETSRDPKLFNWQTLKSQLKQAIQNLATKSKKKIKAQDSDSSFGSDSDPSQDQMTAKQKGQYFLDPTLASKIGLTEVKIIKKSKIKNKNQIQNDNRGGIKSREEKVQKYDMKYDMIIDGFKEKFVVTTKQQKSDIFTPYIESRDEQLKQKKSKQNNFIIKQQSRSTTKILPFKFSEREKPSIQKTNRKSVQILVKRPQKLSVPELPRVETKSNFWASLKKQYEFLLFQRKKKEPI